MKYIKPEIELVELYAEEPVCAGAASNQMPVMIEDGEFNGDGQ